MLKTKQSRARDVLEVHEEDSDNEHESDSEDEPVNNRPAAVRASAAPVNFKNDYKTRRQILRERPKRMTKKELKEKRQMKLSKITVGLIKPDVTTDREKERVLRRIATKGVAQLFNAVAVRQRTLAEEMAKKMSAKERKEAEAKLRGQSFEVNAKETRMKQEDDDEDDMNDSNVKPETDDDYEE